MQKFECLDDIIGVTNDFCQCLHGRITPEEFQKLTVSKSGMYLDRVEGGLMMRNISQPDKCKSFLDIQKNAIEDAKTFFVADVLAQLNLKYQVKKTNFVGEIGKVSYVGSMNTSKRLQFLKIQTNNDAVLQLDRLRVFLNMDLTTKVWIMQVEEGMTDGVMIYENEEVVSANKILTISFENGFKLPLSKNGKKQDYYFVYEKLDNATQPRDIKVSCGCSGGDAFAEFLFVSGGEADNFSEIATAINDKFTHGISIDVKIKCETGSVVCKQYDENDAIAYVTAFAILYKSAELVIENVMNSGSVDRYTLLANDRLWGKRSHFKKEYEGRIKYLSENIDVSSSDCFFCRDNEMYIDGILN